MTIADMHVARYDGCSASELAALCGVPRVDLLGETGSTLDVAHALAADGAPAGTVVVADTQTTGRGRHGRAWVSQAGAGVWCTIIERPGNTGALDVLSVRVGLAVAAALDGLAREHLRLKWPNDILTSTGKLGGILVETRLSGDQVAWVAIGIGVNVRRPDIPGSAGFPDGVRRLDVLAAIVRGARAAAERSGALSPIESAQWTDRDALLHRKIVSPANGIVCGIDTSGALIVDTASGTQLHRAGTIQLAEDA